VTPLDYPLAITGWLGHLVWRAVRGSRPATWAVIVGLLVLTAIPIVLVSTTPRPTNLSFEDMSLERIPANTSWGRMVGDFQIVESPAGTQYELHDPNHDGWYVIIFTEHPPPVGPAMITGQISPHRATSGNIGTIAADDPAVPPVDEPIWLYLTPAVLAIVLAFGLRLGYPVLRRDRADTAPGHPIPAGAAIPGDWSGRIGGVTVARDQPRAVSLAAVPVPDLPDLADITIADMAADRTTPSVRVRRAAPLKVIRLVRIQGARPGLEIHTAGADVVLSFAEPADRARFVASIR
jgi:hypothetical protein